MDPGVYSNRMCPHEPPPRVCVPSFYPYCDRFSQALTDASLIALACQERFKVWKQLAEQHGPVNSELWDIDRIFPFTDTAVGLASRYEVCGLVQLILRFI